jgi:hypothetical protein
MSKATTFDMPDPDKIQLKHNSDSTFDFNCGPQMPFPVTVEFVPAADTADGIAGSIRGIEF